MQILVITLLAAGLWLILSFFQEIVRSRRYRSFPNVEGIITKMALKKRKGRIKTWTPEMEYSYQVGDRTYCGTRLTFSKVVIEEKTNGKIRELFAEGNPIRVYYNPRNPSDSVLNPNGADLKNRLILGVVLALAGVSLYLIF